MRAIASWIGLLCVVSFGVARADEQPLRWVRSLDEAKAIAAKEHKDLFVNFTGLEWCGACVEFEAEVLSRPEFRAAADDVVLVDLDFPSDRDKLGALKDPYEAWVKHYLIHAFPTMMLADETGRPYAYFTGYDSEPGIAKYMDQLAVARKARQLRDQEFSEAKKATGADRARKLHAAISSLASALGTLQEREGDALLTFYSAEVDDICRLDADNALKLREVYDARQQARDEQGRRSAVLAELKRHQTKKEDFPAAIAYIDEQLKQITTDGTLRYRLERERFFLQEGMEQYADALETLRRILKDRSGEAEDRRWMLNRQAILLNRLGRLDEALSSYDEQIAAAANDRQLRAYFLSWKVNILFGTGRHDQLIATSRELLATERPKSYEWSQAVFYLAMSLEEAGRNEEAISVYREQLAYDREIGHDGAFTLLSISRLQHALGRADAERDTLDEVEKLLSTRADRPAKQKEVDKLREMLKKARESQLKAASE